MTFKIKIGSRTQVWNGVAEKTSGGLKKEDLIKVNGRYKSKVQSKRMKNKNLNPLAKNGMLQKKGSKKFGRVYKDDKNDKKPKTKKTFFGLF